MERVRYKQTQKMGKTHQGSFSARLLTVMTASTFVTPHKMQAQEQCVLLQPIAAGEVLDLPKCVEIQLSTMTAVQLQCCNVNSSK